MGNDFFLVATKIDAVRRLDCRIELAVSFHKLGEERGVVWVVHIGKRRPVLRSAGIKHGLRAAFHIVPPLFAWAWPDKTVVDDASRVLIVSLETSGYPSHPCVVSL